MLHALKLTHQQKTTTTTNIHTVKACALNPQATQNKKGKLRVLCCWNTSTLLENLSLRYVDGHAKPWDVSPLRPHSIPITAKSENKHKTKLKTALVPSVPSLEHTHAYTHAYIHIQLKHPWSQTGEHGRAYQQQHLTCGCDCSLWMRANSVCQWAASRMPSAWSWQWSGQTDK